MMLGCRHSFAQLTARFICTHGTVGMEGWGLGKRPGSGEVLVWRQGGGKCEVGWGHSGRGWRRADRFEDKGAGAAAGIGSVSLSPEPDSNNHTMLHNKAKAEMRNWCILCLLCIAGTEMWHQVLPGTQPVMRYLYLNLWVFLEATHCGLAHVYFSKGGGGSFPPICGV